MALKGEGGAVGTDVSGEQGAQDVVQRVLDVVPCGHTDRRRMLGARHETARRASTPFVVEVAEGLAAEGGRATGYSVGLEVLTSWYMHRSPVTPVPGNPWKEEISQMRGGKSLDRNEFRVLSSEFQENKPQRTQRGRRKRKNKRHATAGEPLLVYLFPE